MHIGDDSGHYNAYIQCVHIFHIAHFTLLLISQRRRRHPNLHTAQWQVPISYLIIAHRQINYLQSLYKNYPPDHFSSKQEPHHVLQYKKKIKITFCVIFSNLYQNVKVAIFIFQSSHRYTLVRVSVHFTKKNNYTVICYMK